MLEILNDKSMVRPHLENWGLKMEDWVLKDWTRTGFATYYSLLYTKTQYYSDEKSQGLLSLTAQRAECET